MLFVCIGNACRSQMAEGFARSYGADVMEAHSAGLAPAVSVPSLTRQVMRRIIDVHKELLALIEIRDPAGARRLMDDHVKMIRSRRVSEHNKSKLKTINCC